MTVFVSAKPIPADRLMAVRPGSRPVENKPVDHRQRTADLVEAFHKDADCMVVGGSIRNAADPRAVALTVWQAVAEVCK